MRDQVVLGVILFAIGILVYYLPVMKGPDAFFGVPVSEEFYRGPRAGRYLRAYRMVTAALVLGALMLSLGALGRVIAAPLRVLLATVAVALGPMVPIVLIWRQMRSHEARPEAAFVNNGALGPPQDKWRYVSPWVEVAFWSVVLLLAGLAVTQYPQLPPRIPTHWNAAGQADGWAAKNPLVLASLFLLMVYTHAIMLALLVGMAQMRITVPAQGAEDYLTARERYMRMWVIMPNTLRLGVTMMLGGIVWASLFGIEAQARGETPPGMALVWAGTAVLCGAIGCMIIKGLRLRKAMRLVAGPGSLERVTPTEGWIGGIVYYNRSDPALWVEKRIGIGWTINFAHPTAWAIIGLAIVVPLGLLALALAGTAR